MLFQTRPFLLVSLILVTTFFASCSKKMMSVLVEDVGGNVELIYAGSESPNNLVKEIRFYPNGDTLSVTPMKKGAVNGTVAFYYPKNKPKEKTTFENGKQQGLFRRFDKEGVLVLEGNLENGQKSGAWITWYDEVQKQEVRNYSNDQPDGKWSYWYMDGELKREEVYKNGKLLEEKDFN